MILNNYRGMEFIQTENPQALSPDFILTLHRILTGVGRQHVFAPVRDLVERLRGDVPRTSQG